MSSISFERVVIDGREVPASFHDAVLKLKDATAKQWVSLDADGRYTTMKGPARIYCAIGYLLPPTARHKLADSVKYINEVEKVLELQTHEIELLMGISMEDALAVQIRFDEISRSYLTISTGKWMRAEAKKEAYKTHRRSWTEYLDSLLERDNYSLE